MGAAILKPDTDRKLLISDVTYHKRFVLASYNNVNGGQPNLYFWNKSVFTNNTTLLVQIVSFVTEMDKENWLVIVRLRTGPGKVTRMAKPEYLWLDRDPDGHTILVPFEVGTCNFIFFPVIPFNIRGSRNDYPPVIRIISLYLWYQFVIIPLGFWGTFISITHLNHIIWW